MTIDWEKFIDGIKDPKDLREDKNGGRIFVVGQIYGDLPKLVKMLELIENNGPIAKNDTVVFLGNFIWEKGPSMDIINCLYSYWLKREDQVVVLRGQCEEHFILSKPKFFKTPLGENLVENYRLKSEQHYHLPRKNVVQVKSLINARRWLETCTKYFHETESFYIMTSGVNPKLDWSEQRLRSFLYMGEQMEKSDRIYPKTIVYGHHREKVETKNSRIGIGVGDPKGNALSCVVLSDTASKTNGKSELLEVMKVIPAKKITATVTPNVPEAKPTLTLEKEKEQATGA